MYIMTAWTEAAETTVRSKDPKVILERARALVADGMRISIIRTSTGETLAINEIEDEATRAGSTG